MQISLAPELKPPHQTDSLPVWRHLRHDVAPIPVWIPVVKLTTHVLRRPSCATRSNWAMCLKQMRRPWKKKCNEAHYCLWITNQAVVPRSVAKENLPSWNHHTLCRQHLTAHSWCTIHFLVSRGKIAKGRSPWLKGHQVQHDIDCWVLLTRKELT
jgi:hypothetical protein